ncbi:hypothetical protein chiPu_0008147 [Chiloscyllium punctatum]|uniref:Uncharacterized protein n=1 Tax=Chiloscyllium punctatum TaxID=137246 RepID=A0A401SH76_CHIPU|nr:hypothetical protein [Chiloscyllium punctatum]
MRNREIARSGKRPRTKKNHTTHYSHSAGEPTSQPQQHGSTDERAAGCRFAEPPPPTPTVRAPVLGMPPACPLPFPQGARSRATSTASPPPSPNGAFCPNRLSACKVWVRVRLVLAQGCFLS